MAIILFLLGLCFGSFANVLIDRVQNKRSVKGFSKCDFCGYQLKWFDNIPVLSFLFLQGKCRKCHKKLSWQYPVVEFLSGLLFALTYLILFQDRFLANWMEAGFYIELVYSLLVAFLLFVILVWDYKYLIIPDFLVLIGLVVTVVFEIYKAFQNGCFVGSWECPLVAGVLGSLAVGGFFGILYLSSGGRWIGGGDVKIGFWLGFLVKLKMTYFFILFAYLIGSVVAVYLLISSKKKMKSQIPFGPFLVVSAYLIIFGRDVILEMWNNLVF
jgi:prepilin signal peptidase PulO-like enzyme (type II secretory pathway)